jgi:hypothetical protein
LAGAIGAGAAVGEPTTSADGEGEGDGDGDVEPMVATGGEEDPDIIAVAAGLAALPHAENTATANPTAA